MSTPLLKTQQVAQALQIGVSTVKRWVDAGELKATRTVGGHRLIPLDEAIRFAEDRDLPTSGLERLGERRPETVKVVDETLCNRLFGLLKEGRAREAKGLIVSAHERLGCGARLADDLLQPVMERIGHGWMLGAIEVYQEHQASQIVAASLAELLNATPAPRGESAPLALGATPEGDLYSLGLLVGELALREAGWRVRNLGPNLPLESLAEAVRTYRPRLVFLSIANLSDPAFFLRSYARFHEVASSLGTDVMLGGRALTVELRTRLRATAFGDRMTQLAEYGRRRVSGESLEFAGMPSTTTDPADSSASAKEG